ncbi:MAG: nucleoside triphosphate pyrophosphohydrolase [Alphaproteobacteria bacterium]|nr:nucleoside triphosphate pyrophosphohydrolase [Alphaproteobacteria bacterium]
MTADTDDAARIERLVRIMAKLRDPNGGCPWDLEQDFATIAPYTIEEAYEVAEAIAEADMVALRGELGDLLFQVVFHAQMADEAGEFSFWDVVDTVADKMVQRHPHVFGDGKVATATAQTHAWEAQKAAERARAAERQGRAPSALDGVALAYPALMRALKLQNRAARVGFDWPDALPVLDKVEEEVVELRQALNDGDDGGEAAAEELGDLFFALVNLARHLEIDPEAALRGANAKFERRFRRVETLLAHQGVDSESATLEALDQLWDAAKAEETKA